MDAETTNASEVALQRNEEVFDQNLAEMLLNYPVIWNKTGNSFKITQRRENALKALAEALGSTAEYVARRYKALREKYRKEKLKMESATRSGAGAITFEPWPLMQTMNFLDAVMRKRKTSSSLPNAAGVGEIEELYVDVDVHSAQMESEVDELIESPATTSTSTASAASTAKCGGQKKRRQGIKEETSDMVKQLLTASNCLINATETRGQAYASYVAKEIDSFPPDLQDELIYDIQTVIINYKRKLKNLNV